MKALNSPVGLAVASVAKHEVGLDSGFDFVVLTCEVLLGYAENFQ